MFGKLNTLLARLLIGSAIPLVLFALVGVVAGIMVTRLVSALRREKHSHEVISNSLLMSLKLEAIRTRAETVPLGPALARQQRYRDANAEIQALGRRIAQAVGEGRQQRTIERVLELESRLVERLEQPGAMLDEGILSRFKEIEKLLDRFIAAERELLETRREAAERTASQGYPVIATAAGLALLLTVLLSLSAARSVTKPVGRLREAAGQLVAGRFKSVTPEGPTEVADLIVLFNHMALTLSERASLLARQEERYRTYIGAIAHILWTTNAEGAVTADLPSWRAYTGQSEESVRGEGWLDAVHPEDRECARESWRAAVAGRNIYEVEFRMRAASGEYHPFNCRAVPIVNADGSVREWVGTCADITEAKQQQALRAAKEAAEGANKAKSEFLTRMSHELRTPLNAVIGMSKMLATQRFGALNAKQADYLADITRAGEHLLALINDILDLAKVEAGKMDVQAEAFALSGPVEALVSTLRPLAESRGVLLEVAACADGEMHTDAARFRQVLYNLLSNAIKFTNQGGRVTIAWEWVEGPALASPARDVPFAEAVRVVVRDTGIGIAPENQGAIWDEFRQVRDAQTPGQQGTGLGLALTRRLVGLLGGEVGLQSAVGQGSTFTFVLPRQLPQAHDEPEAQPPDHRPVALVIEDHGPTNKLLCDWLSGGGLRSVSALDGEAGLSRARELRPALIVLDVQLPGLDGWQVLTALKGDPETASIPVVVVSVSEDRQSAGAFGVQEFFIKPIDREAFLRRLHELQPLLLPREEQQGDRPLVLVVDGNGDAAAGGG